MFVILFSPNQIITRVTYSQSATSLTDERDISVQAVVRFAKKIYGINILWCHIKPNCVVVVRDKHGPTDPLKILRNASVTFHFLFALINKGAHNGPNQTLCL